jgi:hypothetical protein
MPLFDREARSDRKENLLNFAFLASFAVQISVLRLETSLSDKLLGSYGSVILTQSNSTSTGT